MKKLLFVLPFVALMACEKESAIQQTPMPQLATNWSPGLEHNLILDQYYQSHSVGDETSFEDKVAFVNDYMQTKGYDVMQIFADNDQLEDQIEHINSRINDVSDGRAYLTSLKNQGLYDSLTFHYCMLAFDAMEYNFDLNERISELQAVASIVKSDLQLSANQRDMLIGAISVTIHSLEYWEVGPQKTTGLPWYAKDATAAYLSVQVGLAGYAAALTGGWGGLGVIIVSGAIGSMV